VNDLQVHETNMDISQSQIVTYRMKLAVGREASRSISPIKGIEKQKIQILIQNTSLDSKH